MSLLQRQSHRHSRLEDPLHRLAQTIDNGIEDVVSRYEPDELAPRRVAADPYAEWLARREEERAREEAPQVRWVYRHPGARTITP